MAKQTLNTIKNWFKTGLKPTQQQFWDTWDSFWHKDQVIPASSIENLDARFDEKADQEAFDALLQNVNNRFLAYPITVSGTEEYLLPWSGELKAIFGAYGDFSVWLNGSLEQVPISFTTGEDGKPKEYRFTLSGIDALILIK